MTEKCRPNSGEVKILREDTAELLRRDVGSDPFGVLVTDLQGNIVIATSQDVTVEVFDNQADIWQRENPVNIQSTDDIPIVTFASIRDNPKKKQTICQKKKIGDGYTHIDIVLTKTLS